MSWDLLDWNWETFRSRVPSEIGTVLLPVGTVEAHGAIPLGTDVFIPTALARDLAPRLRALVAPAVPYGVTNTLLPYPGSTTISSATFEAYLFEAAAGLADAGFRRIVLLNGHGGQSREVALVVKRLWTEKRVFAAAIEWWGPADKLRGEVFGEVVSGHAGVGETALILAIAPDTVDAARATSIRRAPVRDGVKAYPFPASIILEREETHGEGAPVLDPDKARRFYAMTVEVVEKTIRTCSTAGRNLGSELESSIRRRRGAGLEDSSSDPSRRPSHGESQGERRSEGARPRSRPHREDGRKLSRPYRVRRRAQVPPRRRRSLRHGPPQGRGQARAVEALRTGSRRSRASRTGSGGRPLERAPDLPSDGRRGEGRRHQARHVGRESPGVPRRVVQGSLGRELDHDFLWRCRRHLPERGQIGIFNRSYYEEVLVVRVHGRSSPGRGSAEAPGQGPLEGTGSRTSARSSRYLARNGTVVRKFFLHVSRDEQKRVSSSGSRIRRRTGSSPRRMRRSARTGTGTWRPTRT